jgi:hypothetical protein
METTYHASPPSYSRLYDEHLVQPSGQQQQQAVVVMSADRPVINQPPPLVQSFSGHMVLACIVFWCCGWLFGMIAFILAGKSTFYVIPQGRIS